ncbi:MAG: hypothetical protein EXR70_22295 [Deltaproteobacteria bacterium]|nr:hypothetical protein [Deltaproteobacteria bacterium]
MLTKNILPVIVSGVAILVLAAGLFTHSATNASAAESLRLGFSGATATQLAGTLAVEQKLFELYGVNVEFIQAAGTTMIRALDAGSLDVAIVGGGQALSAYLKGVEVRIIGGLVNTVPYQLWAKPEIAQLKDLKGKLTANTPPGTSLNLAAAVLLQRAGLDPLRDVKLIAFGRLGLVAQSLFTGVVDAALLSPPETIARHMRLTDPETIEEVYQRAIGLYERLPWVPKDAFETVVQLSPSQSNRNPFGVLDMSLLERIDKEGFVRTLYATK